MNIKNLNEKLEKFLNESEEKTFADWFGKDLTGQIYKGDIDCSKSQITSLKGAPAKVTGDFDCSDNQLVSLKGAPQEVSGNFWCSGNSLTSLQGAPQKVGKDFYCQNNSLTSLKEAPQEVGGHFGCAWNSLTSLEGAPQKVDGGFGCGGNQLTSLQGAPQKVGGGFDCSHNKLTSLQGAPQEVGRDFDCSYNELTSLEGAPQKVGGDFKYSGNKLINKNSKSQSNEIMLSIKGIDGVAGSTTVFVDKKFFNWSKQKQIKFLQSELNDSDSDFYEENEPSEYNLVHLTIEEVNINKTGGSLDGTWESEYLGADAAEDIDISVAFELNIEQD